MRHKFFTYIKVGNIVRGRALVLSLLCVAGLISSCSDRIAGGLVTSGGTATSTGSSVTSNSNFGSVQIAMTSASTIQLTVGDNLDLSVVVTTANALQSAAWQKLNTTTGNYDNIQGITEAVDLSNSQTSVQLNLLNAQTADSGTYRCQVIAESLDGSSTQIFNSNTIQVTVGTGPMTNPKPTPSPTPAPTPKPNPTPPTTTSPVAASSCGMQKATGMLAFCETFDTAYPVTTRAGQLDGTLWGVARPGEVNFWARSVWYVGGYPDSDV